MPSVVRSTILAACALAGLTACQDTVISRGTQLDERRVAEIRPGISTKRDVTQLLGTPSTVATFDDRNWYYMEQRYERANFYTEKLTAQDVLLVRFDDSGVVEAVEQRDIQSAQVVEPDPDATPTLGNELSIVQEFLSNIGRFNNDGTNQALSGQRGGRIPGGGI